MKYWLKVGGGMVGPFASKGSALDYYRTYCLNGEYPVSLYSGMYGEQFEYTIR